MTSPVPGLQQNANPARAARMGAMLVGMGVLHFANPKPFDSIVPAELPGDARFYTHASGVAEVITGKHRRHPSSFVGRVLPWA